MVTGHSDVYFVADQDIMDASHTQVSDLVPRSRNGSCYFFIKLASGQFVFVHDTVIYKNLTLPTLEMCDKLIIVYKMGNSVS